MADTFFRINNFKKLKDAISVASLNNMKEATLIYHGSMVETLSGGRSGRQYNIPFTVTGKKYTASAPGEAPAARTGDYKGAFQFQSYIENGNVIGEIGIPENNKKQLGKISIFLERGTSKMAPRPHFKVSFEKVREQIIKTLTRKVSI